MIEAFEEAIEEVINNPSEEGQGPSADNRRADSDVHTIAAGLARLEMPAEAAHDPFADHNSFDEAAHGPLTAENGSEAEWRTFLNRLSGSEWPASRIFVDQASLYGIDDVETEHAQELLQHERNLRSFKDHRRDNLILGLNRPHGCGHKWSTHEYIACRSGYIRDKTDMALPRDFVLPHIRVLRIDYEGPTKYDPHPVLMNCTMQHWYTGDYKIPTGRDDPDHLFPIKLYPKPIACMESPMHFHMHMLAFAMLLDDGILIEAVLGKIRAMLKPASSVKEWLTLATEIYNDPESPLHKLGDHQVRGMVVGTALRHRYTWWIRRPDYLPEEFEATDEDLGKGQFGADLVGTYDDLRAAGYLE